MKCVSYVYLSLLLYTHYCYYIHITHQWNFKVYAGCSTMQPTNTQPQMQTADIHRA